MASKLTLMKWSTGVFGLLALSSSAQAQFTKNTTDIPTGGAANSSRTENVDFGDVDLDGDWDAVFADGGDVAQDQNRIWLNRGPGANLGKFVDSTSTNFPSVNDQSRDIEFVDFDNDSDLDIYVSNTSAIQAQGNRWWRNTGVGDGSYVDETAARWVGLAGANSSIAAGQLLGDGTFIDFSCDCDFGDIDNDGDMDLFHSSYGGVFGGRVPSRIFLNDGAGFFSEFNPSGFKLAGQLIQTNDPGLWCEGTHQQDTTNTDGTRCDIASSALDIDLGDIDGDFDLDILHGARQEEPRMFVNRLSETGVLGFRDVSNSAFPSGWASGNGHYEQEMGDMDGDGDLDIYGLNWNAGFGFTDITMRNNGAGVFGNKSNLPGSGSDDNEGDFIDYDNDGDLDLFVANFSGQDRLYRNNNTLSGNFSFTQVGFPSSAQTGLDADACDVDGDGDYDLFVANDFNAANTYFENTTQTPDTHAPYLPNVEQAPDRAPGAVPTVVRVQVYDNAPYYITWYNPTTLTYTVNGSGGATIPAFSSGGQIFRAEIPGNVTGTISYFFTSEDEYGNTGTSAARNYNSGGAQNSGSIYCDGSTGFCPCIAVGAVDQGCPNTNPNGNGAALVGTGNASFGADTLGFAITDGAFNKAGIIIQGAAALSYPNGNGNVANASGLFCVSPQLRGNVFLTDGTGAATVTNFMSSPFGATAQPFGSTTYYQYWFRDPANPCQNAPAATAAFNFSNGVEVDWDL
ncbi:MAG: hypothetical protein ACI8X5_002599 [Planctomycetota bacterium]|jgi:hypothetical protein